MQAHRLIDTSLVAAEQAHGRGQITPSIPPVIGGRTERDHAQPSVIERRLDTPVGRS